MFKKTVIAKFICAALFASSSASAIEVMEIACTDGEVCRQVSTGLALKALPRPFSKLYESYSTGSEVLASNVTAFSPMYVFERKDVNYSDPANPSGWYKVGTDLKDPIGWMEAKDVLEWKQSIVVSYRHKGTGSSARKSVLMFEDMDSLDKLINDGDRAGKTSKIYAALEEGTSEVPWDGLVTMEPNGYVDIEEKFYLLPILNFKQVKLFDDETKILQIAAAIPNKRADEETGPDTLQNKEWRQKAQKEGVSINGTDVKDLGVDVKFVIDITGSMGPYVEATKNAIRQIANELSSGDTKVAFELVGYRDDVEVLTPGLVEADQFVSAIGKVRASGGDDGQEEGFAGVKKAIDGNWNENTLRAIVLMGDFSSHASDDPKSLTKMSEHEIRSLASTHDVNIVAVHLKGNDPMRKPDHPIAERQFTVLADNPGSQQKAYFPVDADDVANFGESMVELTRTLSTTVDSIKRGDLSVMKEDFEEIDAESGDEIVEKARIIARSIVASSAVVYIGKEATPPTDVTAWVMDRDLIDPTKKSLDVRVLLTKKELNDLIHKLDQVLMALKRSKLTKMNFFKSLQGVLAAAPKGADISVEDAKDLADTGLLPAWIASLPYKSLLLGLSEDIYEALSADERDTLTKRVESRLALYRELTETPDVWVALSEDTSDLEKVFPVRLEDLP